MKKILSFILVMVLAFATCVSVCAVDESTALEQKFYDYCAKVLPEELKPSDGDSVKVYVSTELNGATYFLGCCEWLAFNGENYVATFGNSILESNATYAPYALGVYMSSADEICTLEEAYEAGYITDVSLLNPEFSGWINFYTKHISNPENKYEDGFWAAQCIGDSDNGMTYTYYEGYEYFSPDNTATEDEATADYVVITYYTNLVLDAPTTRYFGDYVMLDSPSTRTPYEFGKCIYVPAENKVYSISEAYRIQLEGIEKAFTEGGLGALIGDMDGDRKLTVRDATAIQKKLAGYELNYEYTKHLSSLVADFNRDNDVNIKDATAIQKHVAGLPY